MNTNFKVIGLTRIGIRPKSTATEADALTLLGSARVVRTLMGGWYNFLRRRKEGWSLYLQGNGLR